MAEDLSVERGGGRPAVPDGSATIGVGMLGYAFMGRAHTNALRTLAYMTWPPPARRQARLDRRPQRAGGARGRRALRLRAVGHGLAGAGRRGPGRRAVRQPGPQQPARRAHDRGSARPASTSSARSRWRAAPRSPTRCGARSQATGVKHLCAFNYRFVPAVRLAREMIECRRARRDPSLPRQLPAGLARRPAAPATWRLDSDRSPDRVRSATSART